MNLRYFRESDTVPFFTISIILALLVPLSAWFLADNITYKLMTNGVTTNASATAKSSDEQDLMLPNKWNALNSYTFKFKTKNGNSQESKINIFQVSQDSALTKLPLPFNTSITYDERNPQISDLSSHVPKNLSAYLLDRLFVIAIEVIFLIVTIYLFTICLKDYRRYYSSF